MVNIFCKIRDWFRPAMLDMKLFKNKRKKNKLLMSYKIRLMFSLMQDSYLLLVKSKYFEARVETQEKSPLLKIVYKDNWIYKKYDLWKFHSSVISLNIMKKCQFYDPEL